MKKVVVFFGIALAGIFLVLSVVDRSEYALEKRLWRLQKRFDKIAQDPRAVPTPTYVALIREYERLIARYPGSPHSPEMLLQVGKIYLLKEDLAAAREAFLKVAERGTGRPEMAAQALSQVGLICERGGDAEQAIATYISIIQRYPLTDIGLNTPLYVANYLGRIGKREEARSAADSAITFYSTVVSQQPRSMVQFNALRLLAASYMVKEQWAEALDVFGRLLLEFPEAEYLTEERAEFLTQAINTIASVHLRDQGIPVRLYRTFLERNPGHDLAEEFEELLEGLEAFQGADAQEP